MLKFGSKIVPRSELYLNLVKKFGKCSFGFLQPPKGYVVLLNYAPGPLLPRVTQNFGHFSIYPIFLVRMHSSDLPPQQQQQQQKKHSKCNGKPNVLQPSALPLADVRMAATDSVVPMETTPSPVTPPPPLPPPPKSNRLYSEDRVTSDDPDDDDIKGKPGFILESFTEGGLVVVYWFLMLLFHRLLLNLEQASCLCSNLRILFF